MKYVFLLLFLTLASYVGFTQKRTDEQLLKDFMSAKTDTSILSSFERLATHYQNEFPYNKQQLYNKLEQIILQKKDSGIEYILLLLRVALLHTNDSIPVSKVLLHRFVEESRNHHFHKGIISGYIELAQLYIYEGNYQTALSMLLKAQDIAVDSLDDDEQIGMVTNTLGQLYQDLSETEKALYYYKLSIEASFKAGNINNTAATSNNLAMIYKDHLQFDSAKTYYYKSISLFHQSDLQKQITNPMMNLADVFRTTQMYDSAFYYIHQVISSVEKENDVPGFAYWVLAKTFRDSDLPDSAAYYYNKAERVIIREGAPSSLRDFYQDISQFYADRELYDKAYDYTLKFIALKDSTFGMEKNKVIREMEAQYESRKKEQEILKQEEKIRQQQILNYSISASLIISLLLVVITYRSYRQKQRLAKEMLVAKEKAEQSEKFKQQFLANMSHEIRTPMNAVMGMTNLLISKNPRSDQLNYLDGIRQSSETLLHIINDILDLSKIEAGKIELEAIDFRIGDVINQVVKTLQHKADEKGILLLTGIDPEIPKAVTGDPVRLNQILMNLTGNAIKFTDKGSVNIEVKNGNHGIQFSVTDTGIGIPANKVSHIFESFTQAHTSDARRFGGTGLGLSISKQLVEKMGGQISIESVEGSGSTFSFEVIFAEGTEENILEHQHSAQIDGSILNGLKILLIDDNEYNRTVARDTLKSKSDVEITEAVNGKNALEIFMQHDFDVLLMDVQMPVMDGFEATRIIRSTFPSPKNQIPVIALTASVVRNDLDKCKEAGMTDYVPKPFKPSQLISAIAKAKNISLKFDTPAIRKSGTHTGDKYEATDLTYLHEFCDGNPVMMQKYITMFLESAPEFKQKIKSALSENNFAEVATQVHGFKTKWIMMGLHQAKDLAFRLEDHCRKENPHEEQIIKGLSELNELIEKAISELSKYNHV